MTWIKICGITSEADAEAAIEAGASAIGLVFAPSPRRVTMDAALAIAEVARGRAQVVGVFKDAGIAEATHAVVGFDLIQIHGDERLNVSVTVLRGTRPESIDRHAGPDSEILLIDGSEGTGTAYDWTRIRTTRRFVIAGGLTPDNVAQAIAAARPFGVDVSSGVERAPGLKDRERMARFVEAVRRTDASN